MSETLEIERPAPAPQRPSRAGRVRAGLAASRVRRPRAWLAVGIGLVVLVAAASAWLWWSHERHAAAERARAEVVAAAPGIVGDVLSYSVDTLDDDFARAKGHLTGHFAGDFDRLTREQIAPAVRKEKVSSRAEVTSAAVVEAEPDRVVTMLFVNQTTRSASLPDPKVDGSRIEATFTRVDGDWRIESLQPM